jgi:4-diphosphocytidyl-2-C-methyl-D-erythritol kinase
MNSALSERALAPAKVNLFLRIVGRRPDGYHLLDSLMVPVDLCDRIDIAVQPRSRACVVIESDSQEAPANRANLAYRAAELFLDRTGFSAEVRIVVSKQIPVASGLGGGSSDAAAVLTTLNRSLRAGRSVEELMSWAALLGADVPFFVRGRPALVQGIGEKVTPVEGWGGVPMVLAFPGSGLSTAAIYQRYDASLEPSDDSLTKRAAVTSIANLSGRRKPWRELLVNDLEAVAAEANPELLVLKNLLLQLGAEGALMTGSGSAVFGVWPTRPAAEVAAAEVRGRGVWTAAVETVEVSPAAA